MILASLHTYWRYQFSSVQLSRWVMSDSLWPHESKHARPPCPLPTPGVHSDSRPSSQWCHPAISSSVSFSSCPQSLPASESFPMSQLFSWGGQSTGVSALASESEGKKVKSLSHARLFATPWTAKRQVCLSITNCRSLLKLMSIKSLMPSNHLILCHPLLLLPSTFPSIRVFSNELVLRIRWPKYWSFSFNTSPSNEYSGPISFWSPCSPRDSQESSPTPQFKSINSSAFSFPYSPTLTSIHDHWKNHSLD